MGWNPLGERRIGRRAKTRGEIGWAAPDRRSSFWARVRGGSQRETAEVVELSVTGARLLVPHSRSLVVGARAGVELDGHRGEIEVRWAEAVEDGERLVLGVRFVRLSPELAQVINEVIANDRLEAVDWRWETAR